MVQKVDMPTFGFVHTLIMFLMVMMTIRILCLSSNAKQAALSLAKHGMIHWMMVLSCFLISSKSLLQNSCAFIRLTLLMEKSCLNIN